MIFFEFDWLVFAVMALSSFQLAEIAKFALQQTLLVAYAAAVYCYWRLTARVIREVWQT